MQKKLSRFLVLLLEHQTCPNKQSGHYQCASVVLPSVARVKLYPRRGYEQQVFFGLMLQSILRLTHLQHHS